MTLVERSKEIFEQFVIRVEALDEGTIGRREYPLIALSLFGFALNLDRMDGAGYRSLKIYRLIAVSLIVRVVLGEAVFPIHAVVMAHIRTDRFAHDDILEAIIVGHCF
jgi:hypothetical protein